jgi:uncharacterized RDD family membrane protein YckC
LACSTCGASLAPMSRYCLNCGTPVTRQDVIAEAAMPDVSSAAGGLVLPMREEVVRRIAAFLIDILPCLVLASLHFVPVLGWMIFGGLSTCYWLLRDINGSSLGKLALGSVVLRADGGMPTTGQRILRNVPLILPSVLELIPIFGVVLAGIAALVVLPVEILALVLTGRRMGDRLAGTNVFRKVVGF